MLTDLSGVYLAVALVSIIIALTIHEAMHGFAAHWLGDDTAQQSGRLTLNPLAHIDTVTTVLMPMILILLHLPPLLAAKPVPFNPARVRFGEYGAALVGVAGPLTNLLLAALAAGAYHLFGSGLSTFASLSIGIFVEINIWFFIFNMIPIPPLDGSRLLYAFAPEPLQALMEQIEAYGFLVILFFVFFLFQFIAGPLSNIADAIFKFLLV